MRAPMYDVHVSNLLTYASLGAALGAIAAVRGPGGLAASGALLALAVLLDTFDGRFARRFQRNARQRQLGGELDSLVDAVVFGLTPVVMLASLPDYATGLPASIWWAGAFVYLLATVTRLSFFNVEDDHAGFVGLPMPAAALMWSTYLLFPLPSWLVPILFFGSGVAMIWPIAIPRPRGTGLAVFALWAASLVTSHGLMLVR